MHKNADYIPPTNVQPKKTRRRGTKFFAPKSPVVRPVGFRIGQALRKHKAYYYGNDEFNSEKKRTVPPHLRSGFYRAQRKGKKLEEVEVIWVYPTFVNFSLDDVDTVIPIIQKVRK